MPKLNPNDLSIDMIEKLLEIRIEAKRTLDSFNLSPPWQAYHLKYRLKEFDKLIVEHNKIKLS